MKTFLTLLVASTAMTTVIGTTALSARHIIPGDSAGLVALDFEDAAQALPIILADNDGSNSSWGFGRDDADDDDDRRGHDDDRYDDDDDHHDADDDDHHHGHDDDCDDGDDDDDDDDCRGGRNNPTPAGSVAPPQNGLFNTGSAPQVQVN